MNKIFLLNPVFTYLYIFILFDLFPVFTKVNKFIYIYINIDIYKYI